MLDLSGSPCGDTAGKVRVQFVCVHIHVPEFFKSRKMDVLRGASRRFNYTAAGGFVNHNQALLDCGLNGHLSFSMNPDILRIRAITAPTEASDTGPA